MSSAEQQILGQALRQVVLPRHLSRFDDSPLIRPADHRALEETVSRQLRTKDPDELRDGLSNVLYWLYQLDGGGQEEIWAFRTGVRRWALVEALRLIDWIEGPGLICLDQLMMPGFRDLRSLSALRMFLDPERYACLLPLHLRLAEIPGRTVIHEFRSENGRWTVNLNQEVHYSRWCRICQRLAGVLEPVGTWRCVDVERALGALATLGEHETALHLLELGESLGGSA